VLDAQSFKNQVIDFVVIKKQFFSVFYAFC